MNQVSGPVIAVGLVLSAVFIPCAFITGITGQFFRQFALTIAVSTVISAFNSLTLSPRWRPSCCGRRRPITKAAACCRSSPIRSWRDWPGVFWRRGSWMWARPGTGRVGIRTTPPFPQGFAGRGRRGGDCRPRFGLAAQSRAGVCVPAVQHRLQLGHQHLRPRRRPPPAAKRRGACCLRRVCFT